MFEDKIKFLDIDLINYNSQFSIKAKIKKFIY